MKHINTLLLNERGGMAKGDPGTAVGAFQDQNLSVWEGLQLFGVLCQHSQRGADDTAPSFQFRFGLFSQARWLGAGRAF